MKFLKIISAAILTVSMTFNAGARNLDSLLAQVQAQAEDSFVMVEYIAEFQGPDGEFKDRGVIEAQDGMWHLKGSAVEIYTDASGTWIVDRSAAEAYAEPAWTYSDLKSFYESLLAAGSSLEVQLVSSEQSDKKPADYFTPAFGPEWVVTDLR